jgi:hypothetical protein
MSWQQIGDVVRDITERLDESRALKLTVYHVSPEPLVVKVPITVAEQAPMILKIEVEREIRESAS